MYRIKTYNKIAPAGLKYFGNNYEIADEIENPDSILVRSTPLHDESSETTSRQLSA